MRVGLFSDYYLAMDDGTAIATEASRQGLADRGHEVFVICPKLHRARPKGAKVITLPSLPGLIYPGIRLVWPFNRQALEQIRRLKLDVVHIETPLFTGLLGLWAGRKLGKPVVMSAHLDMEFMSQYGIAPLALFGFGLVVAVICRQPIRYLKMMASRRQRRDLGRRANFAWRTLAFLSDQCDVSIAISQKEYDLLADFARRGNLVKVPNGLDLPSARPLAKRAARSKLAIDQSYFIVMTSSRLVREKRLELVIKAMPRLIKKKPQARLLIMNDGPKRRQLVELANALGIADKVIFGGLVPREQIYECLAAADVFVSASLNEVASLAILEAALRAKPLILFDKRLAEPLADGANGFFVGSSRRLADRLAWLADHPVERSRMGRASRQRVIHKYNLDAHSRGLVKAYRQAIKEGSTNNRRTG